MNVNRTARRFAIAVIAVLVAGILPAGALEKQARAFDDDRSDEWNASASLLVRYYNTCTGWLWTWGGFADGDQVGVHVLDSQIYGGALLQSAVLTYSGGQSGYGFTGTISIFAETAGGCPSGSAYASQPFLFRSGMFVIHSWGGLPVYTRFFIVCKVADELGQGNPGRFATDRPSSGPTGPQACGLCYPTNRMTHSFYYGSESSPLCPGSTLNDGVCDAEFLWELLVASTADLDHTSWGSIKALYR